MMTLSGRLKALFLLGFILGVTGCAPKVVVTRLKPAEIAMPGVRRISIARIDGRDGEQLVGKINQGLFESKRFEVLERAALDQILKEHGRGVDVLFESDGLELGKLLPASALVAGTVSKADYSERVDSKPGTCTKSVKSGDKMKSVEYACTRYERIGQASYVADLRVVDTNTGRLLATRTFRKDLTDTNRATDEQPDRIDGEGMLETCRREVATAFIRMIAPYPVDEPVQLAKDGKLPELLVGNGYARQGDWEKAKEHYARAVARVDADPVLPPKSKGKAHYALGLALAFSGAYDDGILELEKAYNLHQTSAWMEMMGRVKRFKIEAEKLKEQQQHAAAPLG